MRFVSFNINGIRAHIHQLKAIIDILQPDVIGLQETKVHNDMFPIKQLENYGYHIYYHGQKGYYGVALLSKAKPVFVQRGLQADIQEIQCRIIMADFLTSKGKLRIINGYFPQGENCNHPIKFSAKKKFYQDLQNYLVTNYNNNSLLLIMGDMNISPTDLDVGITKNSQKQWLYMGRCAFLPEERDWIKRLLNFGFLDTYRHINHNSRYYSWFDYRSEGFQKNQGLRIDLLLASQALSWHIKDAGINYSVRAMHRPSDHAPVWVDFIL